MYICFILGNTAIAKSLISFGAEIDRLATALYYVQDNIIVGRLGPSRFQLTF